MSSGRNGDGEAFDRETAIAFADPEDYAKNQRLRAIYEKREKAYDAIRSAPGWGTKADHREAEYESAFATSAYALDLLELQSRTDVEIELPERHRERFEELFPGGIETFAFFGGKPIPDEANRPSLLMCRAVLAACDEFLAKIGLAGEIDPTDDGDAGFDYSDILEDGPPSGEVPSPSEEGPA